LENSQTYASTLHSIDLSHISRHLVAQKATHSPHRGLTSRSLHSCHRMTPADPGVLTGWGSETNCLRRFLPTTGWDGRYIPSSRDSLCKSLCLPAWSQVPVSAPGYRHERLLRHKDR